MGHHQLDNLDYKILKLIASNARIPFSEVARECNVSGAAIHQRVQKLTNLGIIKGSEFTLDSNRIGFETCAYIGVYLQTPGQFKEVMDKLQNIPEVVECHYTTGKYDMFLKIYARNNNHLLQIIHTKLQPLGLARSSLSKRLSAANCPSKTSRLMKKPKAIIQQATKSREKNL